MFIAGSRRLSRLNVDVKRRIDTMIEKGFTILVGNANGADNAVQRFLAEKGYRAHTTGIIQSGIARVPHQLLERATHRRPAPLLHHRFLLTRQCPSLRQREAIGRQCHTYTEPLQLNGDRIV